MLWYVYEPCEDDGVDLPCRSLIAARILITQRFSTLASRKRSKNQHDEERSKRWRQQRRYSESWQQNIDCYDDEQWNEWMKKWWRALLNQRNETVVAAWLLSTDNIETIIDNEATAIHELITCVCEVPDNNLIGFCLNVHPSTTTKRWRSGRSGRNASSGGQIAPAVCFAAQPVPYRHETKPAIETTQSRHTSDEIARKKGRTARHEEAFVELDTYQKWIETAT